MIEFTLPRTCSGMRLDQAVASVITEYSRARLQQWIREGQLSVEGCSALPKTKVLGGEQIRLIVQTEPQGKWEAEDISLDIIYEDSSLLVVNKPAGLVVHPAAGNWTGTLLNALLHHAPQLDVVPRAGIVHRLDKDTTGLMVVAKTLQAQANLVEQLQMRSVSREYAAITYGCFISGASIELPVGRHSVDRKKMSVSEAGKEAITHYRVAERFRNFTLLNVKLETGRTHQIRVHMAHVKHPLVGDSVYGRLRLPKGASDVLIHALRHFKRQALHARRLSLVHPDTHEVIEWSAPLPEDMQQLIGVLRKEDVDAI